MTTNNTKENRSKKPPDYLDRILDELVFNWCAKQGCYKLMDGCMCREWEIYINAIEDVRKKLKAGGMK